MKLELLKQLVEKQVISKNSQIEIDDKSLSRFLMVTDIKGIDIYGEDIKDGSPHKIQMDSIRRINGMEISRIAELFNINLDGTLRDPGVRRGRKRKIR